METDQKRRSFMTFSALMPLAYSLKQDENKTLPTPPPVREKKGKKIGIALGAGGAKGLAHIPMLEALDELGVVPVCIAGSSVGAVVGSLYATGMSGKEIRKLADRTLFGDEDSLTEALFSKETLEWIEYIDPAIGSGGLVKGEGLLKLLYENITTTRFEELKIPLSVVATDFWHWRERVYDKGMLLGAVKGSMAIPGFFAPVEYEGDILVDGGMVNPLPFDHLLDECDITVAVDVGGTPPDGKGPPSYFDTIFSSFRIMQHAIMTQKLRNGRPDIYVKPDIRDVRTLEFYKSESIYKQALHAKEAFKRELEKALN
jgi:NTE family protein